MPSRVWDRIFQDESLHTKGGRLFIFNSRGDYNPEGVITEFCSCIKTLNLTHKEIVDYLNVICLYLQEEAETDYGDTIK